MQGHKSNHDLVDPKSQPIRFDGFSFVWHSDKGIYTPVSGEENDASPRKKNIESPVFPIRVRRDIYDVVGGIIALATMIVIGMYTYYAGGQWNEMIKATKAATKSADVATCALNENKRQFTQMFGEMQRQTGAQSRAADAAEQQFQANMRQLDMARQQASPHLYTSDTAYIRNGDGQLAGVKFDVANGGSITEVTEEEGAGQVPYSEEAQLADAISKQTQPHPTIFTLDKGASRSIEIMMPDWIQVRNTGRDAFAWRRFSYTDSEGKRKSLCFLFVGSKHGIFPRSCDPQPAKKTH